MATLIEDQPRVPPLEAGDRLTRDEFERRWNAMPQVKKAELIDGVVYMPSPVRYRGHGNQHATLGAWLGLYAAATPGVEVGDNTSLRLDNDNEPQPDMLLRLDHALGGPKRLLHSAPNSVQKSALATVEGRVPAIRRRAGTVVDPWQVETAASRSSKGEARQCATLRNGGEFCARAPAPN